MIVLNPETAQISPRLVLWVRRATRPNLSKRAAISTFWASHGSRTQNQECLHQAGLFLTFFGNPEYLGERRCAAESECSAKRRSTVRSVSSPECEARRASEGAETTGGLVYRPPRKLPSLSDKNIWCDETGQAVLHGGSYHR